VRRASFIAIALVGAISAMAGPPPWPIQSQAAACSVLKRAAVTYHLSRRNLSGRYYCEPLGEAVDYFLVGLRYRTTPDELVGSNLIGWFAIRKSDGTVFDWDINEDKALPLHPRPPFEKVN